MKSRKILNFGNIAQCTNAVTACIRLLVLMFFLCTCVHMSVWKYTYSVHMCTYTYTCVLVYTYVFVNVYPFPCKHISMKTHVHVHIMYICEGDIIDRQTNKQTKTDVNFCVLSLAFQQYEQKFRSDKNCLRTEARKFQLKRKKKTEYFYSFSESFLQ